MVKRFVKWWRGIGTRKLIVLRVDFSVTPERLETLQGQLGPLREKYGLDFIVLEPGMTLSRFNDI